VPAPGQPVRRYPKCLFLEASDATAVPSLPFLAANILRTPGSLPDNLCPQPRPADRGTHADADNVPRIVYTLPPLASHQDDVRSSPARARWALYREIYNRCLATWFWDERGSECGDSRIYKDKVVVVGASNPLRRDRHYTPLGDMAGAEVVINAIESFLVYPDNRDRSFLEILCADMRTVWWSGVIWFGYFLVQGWSHRPRPGTVTWWRRASRKVLLGLAFLAAFGLVCAVTVMDAFHPGGPVPSLDLLIPTLAIGLEVYVEALSGLVHWIEGWGRRLLRVPMPDRFE
jgi:hypothetical protein